MMISVSSLASVGSIDRSLIYASVLGADLGPNITILGSLSSMLWLVLLRQRGLDIRQVQYVKLGLTVMPLIGNTDQGSQFTSEGWIRVLQENAIKISMDGQGRWRDNIVIERLWKTVKYEEIYLKAYESISHAKKELMKFFDRYNTRRPHQGLNDRTPDEAYYGLLYSLSEAA